MAAGMKSGDGNGSLPGQWGDERLGMIGQAGRTVDGDLVCVGNSIGWIQVQRKMVVWETVVRCQGGQWDEWSLMHYLEFKNSNHFRL